MEAGYAEVAYTFSDEMGYYCIEGVKASLEEDNEDFYSSLIGSPST